MSFRLAYNILCLADEIDRREQRDNRRVSVDPFNISDQEFIKTFRLDKERALQLISRLSQHIPREKRNDGLSVQKKVLITLAFYASGSYQTLVGQSVCHGVSQPSVSRAIRQVTKALNLIFPDYVKFPMTRHARDNIKRCFYRKFHIPGVIGCIDGTHVAIIKPSQSEERFFNQKGYHSLNVMIICDSDLNILCVDASKPGAAHNSRIWGDHPLQQHLDGTYEEEQVVLLGDSGYPLRRTMMTPLLNTESGSAEENYNKVHRSARNTVEQCIGVLKARFRCLLAARQLHYDPVFAGQIVNACAMLHNIANKARLPVPQLTSQEREQEERLHVRSRAAEEELHEESRQSLIALNNGQANRELMEGRAVQQALVNRLCMAE